jgi:hypothetical protein
MAKREKEEGGTARVSAMNDLILLRDEFKSQLAGRDELVQRLSNVQNLVRHLSISALVAKP